MLAANKGPDSTLHSTQQNSFRYLLVPAFDPGVLKTSTQGPRFVLTVDYFAPQVQVDNPTGCKEFFCTVILLTKPECSALEVWTGELIHYAPLNITPESLERMCMWKDLKKLDAGGPRVQHVLTLGTSV